MRKILILFSLLTLLLTGCKAEVSRTTEHVEVTITNVYHQDKVVVPQYNSKTMTWSTKTVQQEENEVFVEYNGKEYSFTGKQYYRAYSNRIGDTITGTLTTITYEDGTFTEILDIMN